MKMDLVCVPSLNGTFICLRSRFIYRAEPMNIIEADNARGFRERPPAYRDMPQVYSRCPKLVTRAFATTPCPLAIEFARMGRTHNCGEDNALDDATPDSRDKVFATTMVQQFDKTFRQLFAAARTEVQIIETDRI